jgi:hypothetical protein
LGFYSSLSNCPLEPGFSSKNLSSEPGITIFIKSKPDYNAGEESYPSIYNISILLNPHTAPARTPDPSHYSEMVTCSYQTFAEMPPLSVADALNTSPYFCHLLAYPAATTV